MWRSALHTVRDTNVETASAGKRLAKHKERRRLCKASPLRGPNQKQGSVFRKLGEL